jgi:membrane protein CcdC involved in cytochrome C biogenesis
MIIQVIFSICMLYLVILGFNCARKLTHENPMWLRVIVLAPALAALATLAAMLQDIYVAYEADILMAITMMLIYSVINSHFTDNPWLNIKVKNK